MKGETIKSGILGCGTMGSAILERVLETGIFKARDIFINDKNKDKERKVSQKYKVQALKIDEFLRRSDLVILAIKPQDFFSFAMEISFPKEKILISIMTGKEIDSLKKTLKIRKIVRAMPNLMVKIGQGVIVWKAQGLNLAELKIVRKIFRALGKEIRVRDENLIDQATLISGCGPGYLYFFEDLILEGFNRLGFPEHFTLNLLLNTFLGAILYQKEKKYNLEDLIKMVASKGGVTEKFLDILKEKKIYDIFEKAAQKANNHNIKILKRYDKETAF
jgi:pyrroline-5-carboxylate reductase